MHVQNALVGEPKSTTPSRGVENSKAMPRARATYRHWFISCHPCGPATISCANPAALPRTTTPFMSLFSVVQTAALMESWVQENYIVDIQHAPAAKHNPYCIVQ